MSGYCTGCRGMTASAPACTISCPSPLATNPWGLETGIDRERWGVDEAGALVQVEGGEEVGEAVGRSGEEPNGVEQ